MLQKERTGEFEAQIERQSLWLADVNGVIVRKARDLMAQVHPRVPLRTLDALHLATYLSVVAGPLFTQDRRMIEAATLSGIPLVS